MAVSIAGFPLGTSMDTVFAYGQIPATLREKYLEAHDLVIKAWTERKPFPFNGKYTQIRYVDIWPRPYQQPHPPIWVPGLRQLGNLGLHHRLRLRLLLPQLQGYKVGKMVLDGFWKNWTAATRSSPLPARCLQVVAVSEQDNQIDEYKDDIEYFFKKCLHVPASYASAPGYRSERSVRSGLSQATVAARREQNTEFTWKDFINAGNVIAGSPATVREELRHAIKELRVGNLMLLLQFGDMPKERALKNTHLFGTEVLPYLRDLWDEYDNRWWPQPLQQIQHPAVPGKTG